MSKLAHRLTLLRKQVGGESLIPLVNKADLQDRLNGLQVRTPQSFRHQKMNDELLAKKLKARVLNDGLLYIRSEQSLDKIHDLYNAKNLPKIFQFWPDQIDKNCEQLLFIDTETTGLSGGVGTLVFLLGVAEIEGNKIINHQLLLNGMQGEVAMLHWFNKKLSNKKTLVSYNGKSFDIPLLVNRFRLNKMASPLLTLDHIDLVHWIRRLHKNNWEDCRLPSAEKYCLAFHRKNDISGAEAPGIWSQLIRQAEISQLPALIQHHYWDVLSLVGLLDYVIKRLMQKEKKHINVYSIANYFFTLGNIDSAKNILQSNKTRLCEKGYILLAKIYRKENNYEAALNIWRQLAKNNHELSLEYLAKHYEHKCRQYDVSLNYTQQLIAISENPLHYKRQERLLRKIGF